MSGHHHWYKPVNTSKAVPLEMACYVLKAGQGDIIGISPDGNRVAFHMGQTALCVKASRQRITFVIQGDGKVLFWISIREFRKSFMRKYLGEINQDHA